MFSAWPIAVAFIIMLTLVFLVEWSEKRGHRSLETFGFAIMALTGLYCLAAGLHLAIGWQDPFADMPPEKLVEGATSHARGRGAIVLLVISLWPYVLIAASLFFGGLGFLGLWRQIRPIR
ncbi:hypothetical protein [Hoeflea sp. TYP-13]|uniref:hypothetical protein n=1 Tax=Hoeflea sp. TYP-13 TaxID=3230023 RepID=UPI0034C5DF69